MVRGSKPAAVATGAEAATSSVVCAVLLVGATALAIGAGVCGGQPKRCAYHMTRQTEHEKGRIEGLKVGDSKEIKGTREESLKLLEKGGEKSVNINGGCRAEENGYFWYSTKFWWPVVLACSVAVTAPTNAAPQSAHIKLNLFTFTNFFSCFGKTVACNT